MDLKLLNHAAQTGHHHNAHKHKHTQAEMEERARRQQELHRAEQLAAQAAVIACQIPHEAINAGILKSIVVWRETRKTRAEWNSERKRDVQMMKKSSGAGPSVEEKATEKLDLKFELQGKADYAGVIESDPAPYIRSYNYVAYQLALKGLHPKQPLFNSIRILDFGNQLLGDDKLIEACGGLKRCPLRVLNLGYNEITDRGMSELARNLRSMNFLEELNLAGNLFTDRGVQSIFEDSVYSPTMRRIDLSCTTLGPRSAYFLGLMFSPERTSKLDSLYLGGKIGKKGWGNEFVRVLVEHVCRPNARPLRRLSIPAAALSEDGIYSLAALVACSKTLRVLNITKNTLAEPVSRDALRHALRINTSIEELYFRQSGLNKHQRDALAFACKSTFRPSWHETVEIAQRTALELRKSLVISYKIELDIFNNWQAGKPLPWPVIAATPSSEEEIDDDELSAAPLVDLTASMGLVRGIVAALRSIDQTGVFLKTLLISAAEAVDFLVTSLEAAGKDPEASLDALSDAAAACERRKLIAHAKRLESIGTVEKFSGAKAGLAGRGDSEAGSSPKTTKSKKGKAKAGGVNLNTLFMSIEDYRSALIEQGDANEVFISDVFLEKIRLDSDLVADGDDRIGGGGGGGVVGGLIKTAPAKRAGDNWIPSLSVVGPASAFVHYLYAVAPAERIRAQRSLEAYERDQKRLADIAAKEERKRLKTIRGGPRFKIIRGVGMGQQANEAKRKEETELAAARALESAGSQNRKTPTGGRRRTQLTVAGEFVLGDDEEEEDDDENEDETGEQGEVLREVTRFTVPKRDLQRKFETLLVEDLTDNEASIRKIQEYLSRHGRSTHVRRTAVELRMPRTQGLSFIEGDVTFSVYTEAEEERCEPLQHITRLNTTRQATALEVRMRDRQLKHQLERERAING